MSGCDLELNLSPRQLCDAELICNGGFSPLTGFMTKEEYMSVVENNRLPNGLLFGLPVVYDTDRDDLKPGEARIGQTVNSTSGRFGSIRRTAVEARVIDLDTLTP